MSFTKKEIHQVVRSIQDLQQMRLASENEESLLDVVEHIISNDRKLETAISTTKKKLDETETAISTTKKKLDETQKKIEILKKRRNKSVISAKIY
jgi:hypothetical protein